MDWNVSCVWVAISMLAMEHSTTSKNKKSSKRPTMYRKRMEIETFLDRNKRKQ